MKNYKVIKEFEYAKKGDIFKEDQEIEGNYVLSMGNSNDNYSISCSMSISPAVVNTLVDNGYLQELKDENSFAEEKLTSISNFIAEAKKQYKKDHDALIDEYNEGNMPQCVKVEADTVYYNMNKILNKIEELINE